MPRPLLFAHPASCEHDTGEHPESPARIVAITAALEELDYLGWQPVSSPLVPRAVLERVHTRAHIERIAAIAAAGGGRLDPDTVMSAGSQEAALRAVGGAVAMVEALVEAGSGAVGYSIHRPPGHHATPERAMGFCLFNNIAVAARHALDGLGLERVMILDWDVHHGNGTQEIFWDCGRVLYVSIHQWPLYPGSGRSFELGAGDGRGTTINLPLPPGSGDSEFVSMVRDVAVPVGRAYRPQLLLLSAGYDAHRDDPLADCRVSDAGFAAMAALVRDLAADLEIPLGCVLEGGYELGVLARCVPATMRQLTDDGHAPEGPLAIGSAPALVLDARARLAPIWPALAR